MQAWLIYDSEGAQRNADYISYHLEAGKNYHIQFEVIIIEDKENITLPQGTPSFALVRTICPAINEELERRKIPVFNNAMISRICNDKGKTTAYIKENTKVPVSETLTFTNEELSEALLREYPDWVIKAVDGHGGKQVFRTTDNFSVIQKEIGKSDFILQPFVKGPGKDVRVYVIGNEIIAAIERTAKGGFKSNFSLGGSVKPYPLSKEEKNLVQQICQVFSFGLVGIDFLINNKGKFVFNEIEDVVGARMLYQCYPNIQLLEKYFSFLVDKMLQ